MRPRSERKKQSDRTTECGICHEQAMEFRCKQCHKPVCDECAFKIEHGAFCCRECANTYRDFKRDQEDEEEKPRRQRPLLMTAVVLLALAVLAVLARRMGVFDRLLP